MLYTADVNTVSCPIIWASTLLKRNTRSPNSEHRLYHGIIKSITIIPWLYLESGIDTTNPLIYKQWSIIIIIQLGDNLIILTFEWLDWNGRCASKIKFELFMSNSVIKVFFEIHFNGHISFLIIRDVFIMCLFKIMNMNEQSSISTFVKKKQHKSTR